MKLLPQEVRRIRQHAILTLRLSPDTKTEITKKEILGFTKNLLNTIQQKRQIKHWELVLMETDKEDG